MDAGDTAKYRVFVHALKSASKTVGADDVFELARTLEEHARENEADIIRQRSGELEELLMSRTDTLKKVLGLQ